MDVLKEEISIQQRVRNAAIAQIGEDEWIRLEPVDRNKLMDMVYGEVVTYAEAISLDVGLTDNTCITRCEQLINEVIHSDDPLVSAANIVGSLIQEVRGLGFFDSIVSNEDVTTHIKLILTDRYNQKNEDIDTLLPTLISYLVCKRLCIRVQQEITNNANKIDVITLYGEIKHTFICAEQLYALRKSKNVFSTIKNIHESIKAHEVNREKVDAANERWSLLNNERPALKRQFLSIMDENNFSSFDECASFIHSNIEPTDPKTGKKLGWRWIRNRLSEARKGDFT